MNDATRSVLLAFSIASLHELSFALVYFTICHCQTFITLDYVAALSLFLGLGLIFCKGWQRRILLYATIFILCYYLVVIGIDGEWPFTVKGFLPSKYFYDLAPNATEVFSWLGMITLGFLPVGLLEKKILL